MKRFAAWMLFLLSGVTVPAADMPLSPVITDETVCLFQWNGDQSWAAYQKTASYQAFYESGLMPALIGQFPTLTSKVIIPDLASELDIPAELVATKAFDVIKPAWSKGGVLSLGCHKQDEMLLPYLMLVIHEGAEGYATVKELIGKENEDAEEVELSGRTVLKSEAQKSKELFGCWAEGNDLVLFVGFDISGEAAQIDSLLAAKDTKPLSDLETWNESWTDEPIPTDSIRLWTNIPGLFAFCQKAIEVPEAPFAMVMAWTGLDQWQAFAFHTGCHEKHLVHQWSLRSKKSPLEIIGWGDQTVTLDQLPPLPQDVTSFSLQVVDLKKVSQRIVKLHDELTADSGPLIRLFDEVFGLEDLKVKIKDNEEFKTQAETFTAIASALEPITCLYIDPKHQLLPWGIPTLAIKVKDEAALIAQFEKLGLKRDDRWGCPTFYQSSDLFKAWETTGTSGGGSDSKLHTETSLGTTTIAICDGWLVAGVQPQTVQTFVLRSRGKLPRWNANAIPAETRNKLPQQFARFVFDDPRPGIETLAKLAPWVQNGMQSLVASLSHEETDEEDVKTASADEDGKGAVVAADFKKLLSSPLDIPPVELVTAPLFPNVSVTTVKGNVTQERAYGSTFAQDPIVWTVVSFFSFSFLVDLL